MSRNFISLGTEVIDLEIKALQKLKKISKTPLIEQ